MKKVLLVGSTLLLSFGIGVLGSQSIPPSKSLAESQSSLESNEHSESKSNTMSIAAEWANEPTSIVDLFNSSDVVVIGKAKEMKTGKGITKTFQPFSHDDSVVYTEYDYKIKSILKGSSDLKKIDVINYGGLNNNGTFVKWEGIEILDASKYYLLFLEEIKPSEGMENDPRVGKYRPIDGPAGIYSITSKDAATLRNISNEDIVSATNLLNTSIEVEEQQLEIQRKIINAGLQGILKEIKY